MRLDPPITTFRTQEKNKKQVSSGFFHLCRVTKCSLQTQGLAAPSPPPSLSLAMGAEA